MATPSKTNLSINLNKVALLRNQRDLEIPDVVRAARTVIQAGAHGITVHPRPDQRHIRPGDVTALAALLASEYPQIEYNMEGNPFPDFLALVREVRPTQATLVPDDPDQKTSDHGWDIPAHAGRLETVIGELHELGVRVSLFLDAEPEMMVHARKVGADRIELYTEPYARAFGGPEQGAMLERYVRSAEAARDEGLGVNAGHDLNLENLPTLRRAIPWLAEVSIGHAFTADALWVGFEEATQVYLAALNSA